jgi:hypothetical protein
MNTGTMNVGRRWVTLGLASTLAFPVLVKGAWAQTARPTPEQVLQTWYRLVLELVRHTPTYTPPVASRAFAYLGVTAFEVVAQAGGNLQTLAGQLNELTPVPARNAGVEYDQAATLHAALALAVGELFANTGPTGQRSMNAMDEKLGAKVAEGLSTEVLAQSRLHGEAVAAHILAWSASDGGAVVENMGFPITYELSKGPEHWVPTSLIVQQQLPLLPTWGQNRTFAMPNGASCGLPPPPQYSEEPGSEFYLEAKEVVDAKANLTKEQRAIARFWSDDPMLSPTPPGHWISIAMQILERDAADVERRAEVLALLGISLADSFIGCWNSKFEYDLVRPVTYIRRTMDPKWESILTTPPFPEYPSGHSTQSAAAAAVLTALFGENFAFEDTTHVDDGLPSRSFASFDAAADEAGISRLYGGIHFRSAIERGLEQGRCIGAHTAAIKTRI